MMNKAERGEQRKGLRSADGDAKYIPKRKDWTREIEGIY